MNPALPATTPITSAKVVKKVDPDVIAYLNNYQKPEDLSRLVQDYNSKIQNYIDNKQFLTRIADAVMQLPDVNSRIQLSTVPNWRGYYGMVFKDRVQEEFDFILAKKFILLHDRAKNKGFDFDLTLADVRRLLKLKRCYYTQTVLTDNDPNLSTHRTIDRIDNKKGYVKGNVVVCSLQINQLKSHLFESATSVTAVDPELLYRFITKLLNK